MEVAVTGATGFVGATLVRRLLARDDTVRVLVRDPGAAICRLPAVRVFQGDLAKPEGVPADFIAGADVLYHCAAEIYDERRMKATNIEGTRTLARLAAGRIGRWVHLSSAAVYGAVRSGRITEDSPIQPDSVYGGTKAESEAIVQAAALAGGYGVTILRPSNIFGIGMPGTSLFKLFAMIDRGLFCFVGRPQATMNYVHVENVATALILCGSCDGASGRTYNVSDQMPIEHLVAIVAGEIGVRRPALRLPEAPLRILAGALGRLPGIPLAHRNLDALTQRASYASDRIRRELAYDSPVSFEAGLRELVRNWKQSRSRRVESKAPPDRKAERILKARICVVVASPMTLRAFIAPHLAAMQARYEVTTVANAVSSEPRQVGPEIDFIPLPIERRISPLRDLIALARLVRLIRRSRFAAIQSLTPKAGLLAMLAGFLSRVPVRVHTFTGQVWLTRRGAARWFLKLMDRIIAGCATHVLVDSASQRDFLISEGVVSAKKSRVLGKGSVCGVDASRFRPDIEARKAVRERLGLDGKAVVFLYLGRLTRDKGVLDLAAAFARVAAEGHDARLLVVGPDEDGIRPRMKEVLGAAAAHARFVDYTDRAETYMTAADVSCLPSFREGFGVTVIEAAACGIPSIGSRIYGVTDAIEEGATGLLFEAGNVEDLTRCMVRLASDPVLRRSLGGRARERALRDFRAEFIVDELQRFLASAIGPTRR